MQRLIKFRAWNKQANRFVNDGDLKHYAVTLDGEVINFDSSGYDYIEHFDVVRYTGIKDKNGNDLYEGDVCWLADNEIFGEVIWDEGAWCYHWGNIFENLHDCADSLELRGNVYDNPELLK